MTPKRRSSGKPAVEKPIRKEPNKRKRKTSEDKDKSFQVSEEESTSEKPVVEKPIQKEPKKRKRKTSEDKDKSFKISEEERATGKPVVEKPIKKEPKKRKRKTSEDKDKSFQVSDEEHASEKPVVEKPIKKEPKKRKSKTSKDKDESSKISEEKVKNKKIKEEDEYGKYQKYNKDKLWKLNRLPHHLLPSFNITEFTDIIKDAREFPLVKISLPHSIFVNSKFPEDIDFCYKRTTALNSYMYRLRTVKIAYLSARKNKKNIRKDEKNGIYCKRLIDFAERREFHPDKYFVRDYDFYYTGGNLAINKRSSQVAHVAGTHMNTLVLSVLNVQQNIPKLHRLTSVDFKNAAKDECEIFEVQWSLSDDDYLLFRQKHCISIQDFRNGKLNVVQNFKTKDVPFISFSQDPVNTHHLAISDLVHKVRVCDIEKGVPIQTLRMMPREEITTENNWNMIKSLDSHVYIYSACKKVSIIDTRLPETEWQSNYCGVSKENACYTFCSLARSKFEHLFYVGANHKAYCVDRRYMGKDIDSKNAVVACWTHQMSTFPLMMATTCHNDAEYIAMQSPLNSDLRICENMQFLQDTEPSIGKTKKARMDLPSEYIYKSPSLPYMPMSLEDLLQEARLEGNCIKQGTGISDRVKACVTGLDFTDDNYSPYLVTATSNGDIFARQVFNPDAQDLKPDTSTASEVMCEFEDNIFRSVRKAPLETTEVCDLSGIKKVFRCPMLSGKSADDLPPRRKYMGRWQKSLQSLSKYKDALAADLLSIWDFEIDDDKDLNITSLNKPVVVNSKVSGWLEDQPEVAQTTMFNMTSIPLDVLSSTNLDSVVPDNSFNDREQMNNKSQIELEPIPLVIKPKVAKKKSRYIKGF